MSLRFLYFTDNPPISNEYSYHGFTDLFDLTIPEVVDQRSLTAQFVRSYLTLEPRNGLLHPYDRSLLPEDSTARKQSGIIMLIAGPLITHFVKASCITYSPTDSIWLVSTTVPAETGLDTSILQEGSHYVLDADTLESTQLSMQIGLHQFINQLTSVLKCWGVKNELPFTRASVRKRVLDPSIYLQGNVVPRQITYVHLTLQIFGSDMDNRFWWNPSASSNNAIPLIMSTVNLSNNTLTLPSEEQDIIPPHSNSVLFGQRYEDRIFSPYLPDEIRTAIDQTIEEILFDIATLNENARRAFEKKISPGNLRKFRERIGKLILKK